MLCVLWSQRETRLLGKAYRAASLLGRALKERAARFQNLLGPKAELDCLQDLDYTSSINYAWYQCAWIVPLRVSVFYIIFFLVCNEKEPKSYCKAEKNCSHFYFFFIFLACKCVYCIAGKS